MDSVKPFEKHYSVTLPTVSHSGFLYKTASAGKPLQDRRAREGEYSILPIQAYGMCQPGCRTSRLGLVLLVDLRVPSGLWQSHLESLRIRPRVYSECLRNGLVGAGDGYGRQALQGEPEVLMEPLVGVALCWAAGIFQMWMGGSLRTRT